MFLRGLGHAGHRDRGRSHSGREPVFGRRRQSTKWSGHAREPDHDAGTYRTLGSWKFGEQVRLPEPLGFEIRTGLGQPWSEERERVI